MMHPNKLRNTSVDSTSQYLQYQQRQIKVLFLTAFFGGFVTFSAGIDDDSPYGTMISNILLSIGFVHLCYSWYQEKKKTKKNGFIRKQKRKWNNDRYKMYAFCVLAGFSTTWFGVMVRSTIVSFYTSSFHTTPTPPTTSTGTMFDLRNKVWFLVGFGSLTSYYYYWIMVQLQNRYKSESQNNEEEGKVVEVDDGFDAKLEQL